MAAPDAPCTLCNGKTTIRDGHLPCPACAGNGQPAAVSTATVPPAPGRAVMPGAFMTAMPRE